MYEVWIVFPWEFVKQDFQFIKGIGKVEWGFLIDGCFCPHFYTLQCCLLYAFMCRSVTAIRDVRNYTGAHIKSSVSS